MRFSRWTNKLEFDVSSFKCSTPGGIDFVDTLLVQTITPLGLCLLVFIGWKVHRHLAESNSTGEDGEAESSTTETSKGKGPTSPLHDDTAITCISPEGGVIELTDKSPDKDTPTSKPYPKLQQISITLVSRTKRK